MCSGLYLLQIETDQSWDFFPNVCQPCLGPLGSSEAPASCFAMAQLSVAFTLVSRNQTLHLPVGAHDRVGSLNIPQQGSEAYQLQSACVSASE